MNFDETMNPEKFISQLSKYSKETIIKTAYNSLFFKHEKFIHDVKWNDINDRFDKLMNKAKSIEEKMFTLIGKKDTESLIKYFQLMDEDNKIHKKIDAVMKEMDTAAGISEEG